MKYLDRQDKYPLTLVTQLILTQMTLFEVHQTEILEHLPQHVEQLLACFARGSADEFFRHSFIQACLKSALSVVTLFYRFLRQKDIENIIQASVILGSEFQYDVKPVLGSIGTQASSKALF